MAGEEASLRVAQVLCFMKDMTLSRVRVGYPGGVTCNSVSERSHDGKIDSELKS